MLSGYYQVSPYQVKAYQATIRAYQGLSGCYQGQGLSGCYQVRAALSGPYQDGIRMVSGCYQDDKKRISPGAHSVVYFWLHSVTSCLCCVFNFLIVLWCCMFAMVINTIPRRAITVTQFLKDFFILFFFPFCLFGFCFSVFIISLSGSNASPYF